MLACCIVLAKPFFDIPEWKEEQPFVKALLPLTIHFFNFDTIFTARRFAAAAALLPRRMAARRRYYELALHAKNPLGRKE